MMSFFFDFGVAGLAPSAPSSTISGDDISLAPFEISVPATAPADFPLL
jgi:hypothetical protein